MPQRLSRILSLGLIAIALFLLADHSRFHGSDDVLNYFKTSSAILGDPLPNNPNIRRVIDPIPPVNYVPHPGLNVPYVEFPSEYPPLALLFFLSPRLFVDAYPAYTIAFGVEMLLLYVLIGWLLWRISRKLATQTLDGWQLAGFLGAIAIGTAYIITRRFDVAATMFAAGALAAEVSASSALAGLLLGLGAATKLWPGFLLPFFLISAWVDRDFRRGVKLLVSTGIGFLLPHVPFIVVGGMKAFSYLGYHSARGIQIESLWGNGLLILSKLGLFETQTAFNFGAMHLTSPPFAKQVVEPLSYVAMLGLYGYVFKLAYEGFRSTAPRSVDRSRDLLIASAALMLATLVTAKVLSTQYILWLVPMTLVLPGSEGTKLRWGTVVAAMLAGVIFPYAYPKYVLPGTWPGLLLICVRNLVYLWMTWHALRALRQVSKLAVDPAPSRSVLT